MRLAIVGSTSFARPEAWGEARALVRATIERHRPEVVVSGGARGVDTIAREEAEAAGVPVVEHLPARQRWGDGYRPRNLRIVEDCTHLLRVACRESTTYGSGWTADRAEEAGRVVERRFL